MNEPLIGILLINKPRGMTSHDVVHKVRKKLQTKKVGHAGTLDPLAEGLLIIAVGSATRFLNYLNLEPKVYEGEMRLGVTTTTQDAEGDTLAESEWHHITIQQLKETAKTFIGEIEQLPPMFSAVKVQGKPLYTYARKGQDIERKTKKVHVHDFQITELNPPVAHFRVSCSTGTYVRTLIHDLGQKLQCGAYLKSLKRLQIGTFSLEQACNLDEISEENLIDLQQAIHPIPILKLGASETQIARNGQALSLPPISDSQIVGLLDNEGRFFCVARRKKDKWQPECVIPLQLQIPAENS